MSKQLYAPQIDNIIDSYGKRGQNNNHYTENSTILMNKVIEEMKKLTPISDNGCRELWLEVDRGSIDAFGDCEEYKDYYEVDNFEDYKKIWIENYPKETYWYRLRTIEIKDNDNNDLMTYYY